MSGSPSSRTRRAGVLALVCALVAFAALSTASGPAAQLERPGQLIGAVSTTHSLLDGLPERGAVLGRADAPVTLVMYGDLQSPITGRFARGALTGLITHWVRGGTVRIEYRSLETATREPGEFLRGQAAALAAGRQARMWFFIELFYRDQGAEDSGYATEAYLDVLARHVPGLRFRQWREDRRHGRWSPLLERDAKLAARRHIDATPDFLVGPTGGRLRNLEWTSLTSTASFDAAIRTALGD